MTALAVDPYPIAQRITAGAAPEDIVTALAPHVGPLEARHVVDDALTILADRDSDERALRACLDAAADALHEATHAARTGDLGVAVRVRRAVEAVAAARAAVTQ